MSKVAVVYFVTSFVSIASIGVIPQGAILFSVSAQSTVSIASIGVIPQGSGLSASSD
jgi:hypothetical protein